jgi:hypothetical protein
VYTEMRMYIRGSSIASRANGRLRKSSCRGPRSVSVART